MTFWFMALESFTEQVGFITNVSNSFKSQDKYSNGIQKKKRLRFHRIQSTYASPSYHHLTSKAYHDKVYVYIKGSLLCPGLYILSNLGVM